MKFDVKLSDWAKYVAQDEDGTWWEFNAKPQLGNTSWDNGRNGRLRLVVRGIPPEDFTKELYEITRGDT